jgi:MOSC domain-containing protein YiiM
MSSYGIVTELQNSPNNNGKSDDRQMTLMDDEVRDWIEQQQTKGLCSSKFKANITIKGLDFTKLHERTLLKIGDSVIEISSVKKKCYGEICKLYDEEQTCPMPSGCSFAKVITQGKIKLADKCTIMIIKPGSAEIFVDGGF